MNRLSIKIPPEASKAIDELIEKTGGKQKSEVVQNAINLMAMLARRTAEDDSIQIVGYDGNPLIFPRISLPDDVKSTDVKLDFEHTESANSENQVRILRNQEARIISAISREFDTIYGLSPREFELVVAELLDVNGYDVRVTPQSRDGGYDILARLETMLGKQTFLVECKKHAPENKVGVSVVRSLSGVVHRMGAHGGVIVTTSLFTAGAKFEASETPFMNLKDYSELKAWILNYRN